eukprot:scaffold353452_cov45-Prasinocladus_malaysianus.AAC.1
MLRTLWKGCAGGSESLGRGFSTGAPAVSRALQGLKDRMAKGSCMRGEENGPLDGLQAGRLNDDHHDAAVM